MARPAPEQLPRLLAGWDGGSAMTLGEHLARHGRPPWRGASPGEVGPLVHTLEDAGLRGRGGAAFPTARKMRAVTGHRGRSVVVANGAEGEPASHKDQLLLTAVPHLVLDGAALAAEAVGASEVVVAVERPSREARAAVQRAIADREATRLDPVPFRLVAVPGRYVAGEATALVNYVDSGVAKPRFVPPRLSERGLRGQPTLVQNVETLAHVALIGRHGGDWFRRLGTADEPGSTLVTVHGAFQRQGFVELELGTTLGAAVMAAGGPREPLSAILVGGYYGTWLRAVDAWDLPLTNAALETVGASLGCGLLGAFPAARCGLQETARVVRYLADESAGQCGPCVHGLRAIAEALTRLASTAPTRGTRARLEHLCGEVVGRGACSYPDGVIGLVRSTLGVFERDLESHLRWGACTPAANPLLPVPDAARRDPGWR